MTMSSTSCARCSWLRRASAVLLATAAATAGTAAADSMRGGDVEQAWFRLSQSLEPANLEAVKERTDEILRSAERMDIDRLPGLALALVVAARTQPPPQAEAILLQAVRLDPTSPEVWFSLAGARLARGAVTSGLAALGRGAATLFGSRRTRDVAWPTAVLVATAVMLAGFTLWGLLAVRRVLPRLWHDLNELGGSWRLGPNSAVLAVLVLGLPLFAAGDVTVLLVWVFSLCWAYLSAGQRTVGVFGLLLVAASPTLVEVSFRSLTHPPNALLQAAVVLEERAYEPQRLDELVALGDVFADDPDYHRLMGDCYRQFGMLDAATLAYREGLRLAPKNGPLSLALGTVHYLESDYNAAQQSFQAARDAGADPAVTNFDLALTLGQLYHFRESEEAMAAAQEAGGARLRALTAGREHQVILPAFRWDEAEAMLARKDPLMLLNRGLADPPLARERTVTHPMAVVGLLGLVLALGHYLVRQHTTGFASSCLKCGRAFCRHCKLSRESQSYCTQCINIFLKKDMVAIDAQLAKRKQLASRQAWLGAERRVADLLLPGLGLAFSGRPFIGAALASVTLAAVAVGVVWLPRYLAPALLSTSLWPLELLCVAAWIGMAALAQFVPVEPR